MLLLELLFETPFIGFKKMRYSLHFLKYFIKYSSLIIKSSFILFPAIMFCNYSSFLQKKSRISHTCNPYLHNGQF